MANQKNLLRENIMKIKKLTFPTILTLMFFVCVSLTIFAQEPKKEDSTMKNAEVVELVKSGLSEGIIVAKIKGSKTEFDTSSTALVKLKESGVSDNLILAMIEAKPKVEESKEPAKPEVQKTADMKEAVGKRRIFLKTDDDEARIEIVKKFSSKGFTFVNEIASAELIFELTYTEGTTKSKAGVFRGGNENEYKTKLGKLVVRLFKESAEYLIYANEYDFARASTMASAFGISAAMPSLKNQVKLYLNDDFLKQMKKAGDKIK
jgi:hypothetical protein